VDSRIGELVRAAAFSLATAEIALRGDVRPDQALAAIADRLELALRSLLGEGSGEEELDGVDSLA
jgi:hypothetical protein